MLVWVNGSKTAKKRKSKMEKTSEYDKTIQSNMKRGRGRPKIHKDVPSHLVCSVTGKRLKTTPIQFRKQLEKSGLDRETFLTTYVSREGRRSMQSPNESTAKKLENIHRGEEVTKLEVFEDPKSCS
jgi:hypothetical protein